MNSCKLCRRFLFILIVGMGVVGCGPKLEPGDNSTNGSRPPADMASHSDTSTDSAIDTTSSSAVDTTISDTVTLDSSTDAPGANDCLTDECPTTESDTLDSDSANIEASDSDTIDANMVDSESASDLTDSDTARETQISVSLTLNPYESVDWETWEQYKANFHTHTTNSDGYDAPDVVIEQYHSKSYDVLAITDHNYTTWPWTDYGMDPSLLGMLAVKGEEYSQSHHVNAWYNFTETSVDMETGIPHVHEQGGLSQINHPGRYAYSNESYLNYYKQFASCIWLEVFNQGDRYPEDRQRWDQINEKLFYEQARFVWGSSNDDKHCIVDLYRNFQFMLAPELTERAIRAAQTSGAFYFAYEPKGSGEAKVPRILSIEVDNDSKTITVNATAYDAIYWIGPGSEVVGEGTVFDFADYAKRTHIEFVQDAVDGYAKRPFVRFVLDGPYGDSYSQPFGFEAVPIDTDTAP